jgi:hypothetical protein
MRIMVTSSLNEINYVRDQLRNKVVMVTAGSWAYTVFKDDVNGFSFTSDLNCFVPRATLHIKHVIDGAHFLDE